MERETGFEPATSSLGSSLLSFKFNKQEKKQVESVSSKSNSVVNSKNKKHDNVAIIQALSLESVNKDYLLNCRCENKSPKTLHKYEEVIHHFIWFARQSKFPNEIDKIKANHIREFIWYLANEPHRWRHVCFIDFRLNFTLSLIAYQL
jgi:hypothetical protein